MAFRIDTGTLRPARKTADGRLRADAYLTRSGVFEYMNPDGSIRREYRPAEEVFRADSLASLSMVPVTDDHPPSMLSAENAREFAVGAVGEAVRKDGDLVAAPLVVYDAPTVSKMDGGKVQVSCGYECAIEETPGIAPGGERYDVIQRDITYNHVAIVDAGRAGASVRVRMDASTMVTPDAPIPAEDSLMEEIRKELTAALSDLAKATNRIDELTARADKAEADLAAAVARADKAEGERDAATARADKAEKERQDAADAAPALMRARIDLENKAAAVLGEDFDASATDLELKRAVVKKLDAVEIPEDKSADYVDARFDAAIDRADLSVAALAGARKATEETRHDAGEDPEVKARRAMMERHANAYKKANQ